VSARAGAAALSLAFAAVACTPGGNNNNGGPDGGVCDPIVTRANLDCADPDVMTALQILRGMSLEEKVQQMSGPAYNPNNMFDQADNDRLGIPGFRYMDGPRGVRWYNSDYGTTVYPVAAARASTWNRELERRIGEAMAHEMRCMGRHVLLAPTINQVMHPRWGRAQESYGEDSFLLGEMGAALVTGAQSTPDEDSYRVQACVKHLAANNIEDTRIYVNAVLDERTLREVYLPHFKRVVDAGVSCVMAAYNRVNGSYNGYSKPLLRDILKGEWKFPGFVISDWFAKGLTLSSPAAGLDIEMPFSSGPFPSQFESAYFYGANLVSAVNGGQVDVKLVDEAALRILHAKVKNGVIDHDMGWTPWLTKSDATQGLAHEAARQGMVLLENGPTRALADDVLPLDRAALSSPTARTWATRGRATPRWSTARWSSRPTRASPRRSPARARRWSPSRRSPATRRRSRPPTSSSSSPPTSTPTWRAPRAARRASGRTAPAWSCRRAIWPTSPARWRSRRRGRGSRSSSS
jgi:beta-glucosidase